MDASRGSGAIFPMPQIPALLYPPPPPRPLPSSALSLTSSSSSSSRHAPSITSFPILVLTVLGILTTSVLLLAYYVFVIRCCLNWHASSSSSSRRGRRRRQQRASSTTGISLPGSSSGDPAEARGLDEAAIQALPAFRYSRKKSAAGGGTTTTNNDAAGSAPASECAVCLGEFEDGERVRMLPACLHVFHVACIDTWLQGNANCPLCRADTATHCVLPLQEPGHGRLRRPQDQEVVIIQLVPGAQEEEAARAQAQQRVAANAAAESTGEAAAAADHHQVGNSDKRKSIGAWHEIDISSREDDECTAKSKGDGDVDLVLPLRKSISMGRTTADEEVHLQIHNILQRNNIISSPSRGDDHDSDSSSSSSV